MASRPKTGDGFDQFSPNTKMKWQAKPEKSKSTQTQKWKSHQKNQNHRNEGP